MSDDKRESYLTMYKVTEVEIPLPEYVRGEDLGDIQSDGVETANGCKKGDVQSDGIETNVGREDDIRSDGVESATVGRRGNIKSDDVQSANSGKKGDVQNDGAETALGDREGDIQNDGVQSANGCKKGDVQNDGIETNVGREDAIRSDGVETATVGRRGNIKSDDEENAHGGENEQKNGLIVLYSDDDKDIDLPVSTKEAEVSGESQNEQLEREIYNLVVNLPIGQKHLFYLLLKENKEGKSKLHLDKQRNVVVVCGIKEDSILARIPENTLRIVKVAGKTEETLKTEIEFFCQSVEKMKKDKTPGGVCLSSSATPTRLKTYEQGENYTVQDYLGKGLQATVTVVQDKATSEYLALKSVPIDKFEPNEIRALYHLRSYEFTPKLHLCKIGTYNIQIFMEVLKDAITMKCVNEQLDSVSSLTPAHKMSFAMHFLKEALEAIENMHRVGWLHRDLHCENVMLLKRPDSIDAKSIQIMIIDFGNAIPITESEKLTSSEAAAHLSDFVNILMQFCSLALCGGLCEAGFESTIEFKSNHESMLSNISDRVPVELQELLRDVVKEGFKIEHAQRDGPEFVQYVKNKASQINIIDIQHFEVAFGHLRFEKPMLGLHTSSKLNQIPPKDCESSIQADSNISVENIIPAAPPPPPVRTKISGHSSAAIATEDGNNGQPENGRGEALQAAIQNIIPAAPPPPPVRTKISGHSSAAIATEDGNNGQPENGRGEALQAAIQNIIPAAPPPPPVRTKISGHSSAAIATEDGNNGQPENGRGEALQAAIQNIIPAAPPPPPVRTKISGHSSAAIATEDGNNGQPENGRGEALQAAIQETTDQLASARKKGGTVDVRHFGTQTDFVAHRRCYKCGEQGHLDFACWHQHAIKCFQCHKYGHKQKHCEQRF